MPIPLSVLDPLPVHAGIDHRTTIETGVALAHRADVLGYHRIWYTEHHNQDVYAASATSVLIAHVAARTERIRVGAGGVMLPNHSPLVIAEQFGTLATLHPDRIDLGVGRGMGAPPHTVRALRRSSPSADPLSADSHAEDLHELRGYLWDQVDTADPEAIRAIPGTGTRVPLYVLGSSVTTARFAAASGLPFCFASHFAPDALEEASRVYRAEFRPSPQSHAPWFIAGVNVTTAETTAEAEEQVWLARRGLAERFAPEQGPLDAQGTRRAFDSPIGRKVLRRYVYSAVGDREETARYLNWFSGHARADELVIEFQTGSPSARMRSLELVAEAMFCARGSVTKEGTVPPALRPNIRH